MLVVSLLACPFESHTSYMPGVPGSSKSESCSISKLSESSVELITFLHIVFGQVYGCLLGAHERTSASSNHAHGDELYSGWPRRFSCPRRHFSCDPGARTLVFGAEPSAEEVEEDLEHREDGH